MNGNTVFDVSSGWIPSGSPQDTPESPEAPEVSEDAPEALAETVEGVVCVPATLKIWAPDGSSQGMCKIETYANGRGGHYFVCPTRMLLGHGLRVEIDVDN